MDFDFNGDRTEDEEKNDCPALYHSYFTFLEENHDVLSPTLFLTPLQFSDSIKSNNTLVNILGKLEMLCCLRFP